MDAKGPKLTLGQAIRRARQEDGITLREFARRLKISPPYLCDIEKDRRSPTEKILSQIAEMLKIPLDNLENLSGRIDPELKDWVQRNPVVGTMLRAMRESGESPSELIRNPQEFSDKVLKPMRQERKA